MAGKIQSVTLQNVRINFRNFAGREAKFNAKGDRNFVIFLDQEVADELSSLGWTVKQLDARNEDEAPQAFIKVKVKYSEFAKPPRIVMITSRGRTNLDESMLDILDWVDIDNVDVIFRAHEGNMNGRDFVTAYAQAVYITIHEDELERKYADVPELTSGQTAITSGHEDPFSGEYEDLGEIEEQRAIGRGGF